MTVDLDALEAAAKAATPGPWKNAAGYKIKVTATGTHCASAWERYTYEPDKEITSEKAQANAVFIAAANPAVVLELIAEVRKARAERDWLARELSSVAHIMHPHGGYAPYCTHEVELDKCFRCWLEAAREGAEETK